MSTDQRLKKNYSIEIVSSDGKLCHSTANANMDSSFTCYNTIMTHYISKISKIAGL